MLRMFKRFQIVELKVNDLKRSVLNEDFLGGFGTQKDDLSGHSRAVYSQQTGRSALRNS